MGRRRSSRQAAVAELTPNEVDDTFQFVPDDAGGVTVMRDGHPQSHVDIDDPLHLEFEYMQQFALVLEVYSPKPPGPLGVTHVGGAGLTMARFIEHTRPGSPQIVLEPDAALTAAVRKHLPLSRNARVRVRAQDGASGVRELKDDSADVVIVDAFADGVIPADIVSPQFAADVARVLKPGGLLLANLADEPGFTWATHAFATWMQHFPHAVIVAAQEVLKGRRYGNVVLAASATETFDVDDVKRAAARAMFPTGVRAGRDLETLMRGAKPFEPGGQHSPPPPAFGKWRVR